MDGSRARDVMLKRLRRQTWESAQPLDDRCTYNVTPVMSYVPGVGSHRKTSSVAESMATGSKPASPAARQVRSNSASALPHSPPAAKTSLLPEMGNLGLPSVSFVSPQLRSLARNLSDEQIAELTRRIRVRVAQVSERMQVKFSQRKAKLDEAAVFDTHVNKARAEAMHHVELQRRLRPGDLECDILKEMIMEQQYRESLNQNYGGKLEAKMAQWFDGTKFQGVTVAGRRRARQRKKAVLAPRFAGAFARAWHRGARKRVAKRKAQSRATRRAQTAAARLNGGRAAHGGGDDSGGGPDALEGAASGGDGGDTGNTKEALAEMMETTETGTTEPPKLDKRPFGRGKFESEIKRAQRQGESRGRSRARRDGRSRRKPGEGDAPAQQQQQQQSSLPQQQQLQGVLAPSTKAAKAAEAAATRKWAISHGIIPSKRSGMDAQHGAILNPAAPLPTGTTVAGGGTDATDIEELVLQEQALREAFNNVHASNSTFRLSTTRMVGIDAIQQARNPTTTVAERKEALLDLKDFKYQYGAALPDSDMRARSRRRVRRVVSSGVPANELTQAVVEERLAASEQLDVPETLRAQALRASRNVKLKPTNPPRPVGRPRPRARRRRNERRVGSAPATVRVRVPVPDIRINSKGDVVFKERADNDMPDPFASSAIELDPRSKNAKGAGKRLLPTSVASAVNEDMVNRLERLWQQLEVPSLQRFDFMCKYSNPEHASHMHAVVDTWEAAVDAVLLREKLMALKRRWKADAEAEATRKISHAVGGAIKRQSSVAGGLRKSPSGSGDGEVHGASPSSGDSKRQGADGDGDGEDRRGSVTDAKLRQALTPSDLSFLHAHECYVDKSTLQDKSDIFQLDHVIAKMDKLCITRADDLLHNFEDVLTYRGQDYVRLIGMAKQEPIRFADNNALARFGTSLLKPVNVDLMV